jgi:hypothetical protein
VRCQEQGTFVEIPRLRIFGEIPRSKIEKKDF